MDVVDPGGEKWRIAARRGPRPGSSLSGNLGELSLVVVVIEAIVVWPPWFVAHFLGLPWRIVIERNGSVVGQERVRGWRRSNRRIEELAESARAGTLQLPA